MDAILARDNIQLDMQSPLEPMTTVNYVEGWRMRLWDKAFCGDFSSKGHFKKGDTFKKCTGADTAVKRVIFRYDLF